MKDSLVLELPARIPTFYFSRFQLLLLMNCVGLKKTSSIQVQEIYFLWSCACLLEWGFQHHHPKIFNNLYCSSFIDFIITSLMMWAVHSWELGSLQDDDDHLSLILRTMHYMPCKPVPEGMGPSFIRKNIFCATREGFTFWFVFS